MTRKLKLYQDSLNGMYAEATSQMMAWQLIRKKCHEDGYPVPTYNQVKELHKIKGEPRQNPK